jgi:hypothetical protein
MTHDQTTGFDHGRVHHQPVLPAIMQGSVICHSNAEPYLGLMPERLTGGLSRAISRCGEPSANWRPKRIKPAD